MEISSYGLNGNPLRAVGEYPAAIACVLTNGHMPHLEPKLHEERIPNMNHEGNTRFVADIEGGTTIGFKRFAFNGAACAETPAAN